MNPSERLFIGTYEHALDSVNRVILPSKWRTGQSEEFFLLDRGAGSLAGSLAIFTQAELMKIMSDIDNSPSRSLAEKRDQKQVFAYARQATCDKQGRFTMDAELLKKLGIHDKVVFAGAVQRFAIWSPKAWEKHHSKVAPKTHVLLDEMGI